MIPTSSPRLSRAKRLPGRVVQLERVQGRLDSDRDGSALVSGYAAADCDVCNSHNQQHERGVCTLPLACVNVRGFTWHMLGGCRMPSMPRASVWLLDCAHASQRLLQLTSNGHITEHSFKKLAAVSCILQLVVTPMHTTLLGTTDVSYNTRVEQITGPCSRWLLPIHPHSAMRNQSDDTITPRPEIVRPTIRGDDCTHVEAFRRRVL